MSNIEETEIVNERPYKLPVVGGGVASWQYPTYIELTPERREALLEIIDSWESDLPYDPFVIPVLRAMLENK